jgi:hypothetical protein
MTPDPLEVLELIDRLGREALVRRDARQRELERDTETLADLAALYRAHAPTGPPPAWAAAVEAGRAAAGRAVRGGFEELFARSPEAATFPSEWCLQLDRVRHAGGGWERRRYAKSPLEYVQDTVMLLADVVAAERRNGASLGALSLEQFCARASNVRYGDRPIARMSVGRHGHLIGEVKRDWPEFGWPLLLQLAGRVVTARRP